MTKVFEVNIGTNASPRFATQHGEASLSPTHLIGDILDKYIRLLGGWCYTESRQSSTEWTVVAQVSLPALALPDWDTLATLLSQDCIAVYDPAADNGRLFGRHSDLWGGFDLQQFIRYPW